MLQACNRSPATEVAHAYSRGSSRRRCLLQACNRSSASLWPPSPDRKPNVCPNQELEAVHCVLQACNLSGASLQPRELEAPLRVLQACNHLTVRRSHLSLTLTLS